MKTSLVYRQDIDFCILGWFNKNYKSIYFFFQSLKDSVINLIISKILVGRIYINQHELKSTWQFSLGLFFGNSSSEIKSEWFFIDSIITLNFMNKSNLTLF
ncbi:hypothetical protein BpHYR1_000743 [Brachionus plicatilis]|uniref:Uncharacterized protein n=1 Tax=Brachionus plicatilis TaxID=10195 RepID=A0A3M7S2V8_BRAPC|nr:hypothetical protein BpHYR1_000743 [Brachionus plicatilis]